MGDADQPQPPSEAVWTYRGYQLRPGEFATSMVHFFRAYVSRADAWRGRLDSTTNWAVITTGAAISITFNSPDAASHLVIPLCTLLVTLFLVTEARRYRYYELWSTRVRLMETDFYAAMLVPPFRPDPDWAESLAENLLHPEFPITSWEAVGRRYRYNYVWIYCVLALAWVVNLWIHPTPVDSLEQFLRRASVGVIPGWIILGLGVVFNLVLFAIGLATRGLHQATGEVLPRYPDDKTATEAAQQAEAEEPESSRPMQAWFRPLSRRRKQLIAVIITGHPRTVYRRIMTETGRGVTEVSGRGAYSGQSQSLLLVALTTTEVANLKRIVRQEDPAAFVVITPAQEILGSGFLPLDPQEGQA